MVATDEMHDWLKSHQWVASWMTLAALTALILLMTIGL